MKKSIVIFVVALVSASFASAARQKCSLLKNSAGINDKASNYYQVALNKSKAPAKQTPAQGDTTF